MAFPCPVTVMLGVGFHLSRNFEHFVLGAEGFLFEDEGLHLDEVDDAFELIFGTDGKLKRNSVLAEFLFDLVHDGHEVRADAIHLVDERKSWNTVLIGLAPHGLRLRLDTANRTENADSAVEDAQRALYLDREVDVARRIDDIDAVVTPERSRGSRSDGDAAFLLLDHPVHGGSPLVYLSDLVRDPRVIEDALGRSGLAGIDVSHDADVPRLLQRYLPCHVFFSKHV